MDIDEIKQEVSDITHEFDRKVAMQVIDYLHSRGYLGGVWQPIDIAPKDKPILVCQSQNGIVRTARGVNDRGDWITGPSPMDYIVKITHWMPLPAAPRSELLCSQSKELCSPKGETK